MNIMFVTRRYFPHGDATSGVIHNLAQEMKNQGHNIQVVGLTAYHEDAKIREWEGIPVTNKYLPASKDREQIIREKKSNPFRIGHALLQKTISKTQKRLFSRNKQLSIEPIYEKNYRKVLRKTFENASCDLCIATLLPIEAVITALDACPQETIFAIYQLDTFWNNASFPFQYGETRKAFEKRLIDESDFVITTSLIKESDEKEYPDHKGTIIEAEFPLITQNEKTKTTTDNSSNKIKHCIFLGTLYPVIRPPEQAVLLLSKIGNNNVLFDFYGTGQQLISDMPFYKEIKNRIILHGTVETQKAKELRFNADYLLNIDNTTTMQVPSKIFEYISTGKPIVNMYFNEDSPTLRYLDKYPNCININLHGNIEQEAMKLQEFLASEKKKNVPYDEIKNLYKENTPEFVSKQIINEYKSAYKRKNSVLKNLSNPDSRQKRNKKLLI